MKRFLYIMLLSIFCVSSCSKEEPQALEKMNQETIFYNSIEAIYNHDEVVDALEQNNEMYSFFKKFNITQYKCTESINYTIVKTTDGLFIVSFNSDGLYGTIQKITFSPSINKANIDNIKSGATLSEVRAVDPDGQYPFLYHSWSGYPQISHHFFESGDYFCIQYEEDVVVNVVHLTI